jgi:hypothetical protein
MTDKKAPQKPKFPSPVSFLVSRISWTAILIPLGIIGMLFLGSMVTGVVSSILKVVGSIGGGLMVAGFITVVIADKESWRVLAGGLSVLVPLLIVFTVLFGFGWLTVFGIYTGILTGVLLLLETRRRINGK